MRIALVSEWMDGWRGGAETSTVQFVQHLLDQGHEVHVFTRSRPAATPLLQVHSIPGAAMSRTRRSTTFAHRVDRLIQRRGFDVIHAVTPCRCADLYQPRGGTTAESMERNLALLPNRTARHLKRWVNMLNLKQRHALSFERYLFQQRPDLLVIAISGYVVHQIKRHYQVPDDRIRMIFNGVNPDPSTNLERARDRAALRRELQIPDETCLVLMVAHNFRLKGVESWLRSLALLKDRGIDRFRTVVVGKGQSARWHHLTARLGIQDRVLFAGPTERIQRFHHGADILVHPTFYDPCSRAVLEGMSAGLPCITTRWDGAAERIQDGINGYVLNDPSNVVELAERACKLEDREWRLRMGAAARESLAGHGMAEHARHMLTVYEEVLKRRRLSGQPSGQGERKVGGFRNNLGIPVNPGAVVE